jgi:hypothetical protein
MAQYLKDALPVYRMLFETAMRDILAGRRWEAGTGNRHIVRTLEFLVRDYGFELPIGRRCGNESNHTYRRGPMEINVIDAGSPATMVTFRVEGKYSVLNRLTVDEVAALIKEHPEMLSGDFRAVSALVEQEQPRSRSKR